MRPIALLAIRQVIEVAAAACTRAFDDRGIRAGDLKCEPREVLSRLTVSITARLPTTISNSLVATGELIVPGEKTATATAPLSTSTAALTANTRHDSDP